MPTRRKKTPLKPLEIAPLVLLFLGILIPIVIIPKPTLVYDDFALFELNRYLREWDLVKLWTQSYWRGVYEQGAVESLYRPIFLSVVMLFKKDYQLSRTVVLLVNALTAYFLLLTFQNEKKSKDKLVPWFGILLAIWTGLNATQLETSLQVVGLMDLGAILFGLVAWRFRETSPWLAISLALIAVGWKETGVIWPIALVGWYAFRKRWLQGSITLAGIFAWGLARYFVCHESILHTLSPDQLLLNPLYEATWYQVLLSNIYLLGLHIKFLFFPYPLSVDYGFGTLPLPVTTIHWEMLLTILLFGFLFHFRKNVPLVAWILMAMVLPSFARNDQMVEPFAVRFGLAFRFGLAYAILSVGRDHLKFFSPKMRSIAPIFVGAVALFNIALFSQRTSEWQSAEKLFHADLLKYPYSAKLLFNLGSTYGADKNLSRSAFYYSRAIRVLPGYAEAHFRLGWVYRSLGDKAKSQFHFKKARDYGISFKEP